MARKRTTFFFRVQSFLKPWLLPLLSLAIAAAIVFMPLKINAVPSQVSLPATENLLQQGKNLYQQQQYQDAVALLQQAIAAFEARGDRWGKAIALSNLSLAHQQLGQWQPAEHAINASLDLLPTASPNLPAESAQILAQTLDIRGGIYFQQGKAQAALDTWQQAAELYLQLKDRAGLIGSQINQAQAMQSLGMYFQAERILTDIARRLEKQPDSAQKAKVLRSLGNVYRRTGDLNNSRQTLSQSLAVAKAAKFNTEDILLSLGNTALAQSQPQTAADFYQQAVTNTASTSTRIKAQLNYLSLLKQEDFPMALELANQIESQLESLPVNNESVIAKINLVENLSRFKSDRSRISVSKLIQILNQAKQQAEELGDERAVSYALGNLAEIHAANGQLARAVELTQQALYRGQTVNAPNITYRWQWQLGRLYKRTGKRIEAIASYTEAVNSLQSLRNDLVALDPKVQFYFRERVEPVYRELADLLLQSQPSPANLVLARQTIESLQLVELENFFRQACLEPKTEIDNIVDRDSSTAVIYPIVLADRLEIIVKSSRNQLLHFTTNIKRETLATIASALREDLLDVTKTVAVKQRSQQLYHWLIEPLETALTANKIDTLVFVLDGSLRNIPMSVLYDQQQQQYLIEKYAIAIAPGLQLVKSRLSSPSKLNVLTGGISRAREIAERRFSSLANVEQELEQIQSRVAKSKQIINQEFTQANLEAQLNRTNFSTVHLATHGKFSSDPEQTFILTWDRLLKTQDLASLMRQYNSNEDEAIELLVLSACETAAGDPLATLGLAGIAVRAGVRSTLASLWFADDRYSAEIMSSFYQELSKGATKAKALQKAQLEVLRQENRPYLWSSFILLGDWL